MVLALIGVRIKTCTIVNCNSCPKCSRQLRSYSHFIWSDWSIWGVMNCECGENPCSQSKGNVTKSFLQKRGPGRLPPLNLPMQYRGESPSCIKLMITSDRALYKSKEPMLTMHACCFSMYVPACLH